MIEQPFVGLARYAFTAVLALLVLAGCGQEPSVERLRLADGRVAPIEHWDGRYLAINYWAEWCTPCREEIGELNSLHADRVNHNLVMLGVNYDGLTGDALLDVMERMDIDFPVLANDVAAHFDYPVPTVLPTTVIVSPERQVIAMLKGPQTEASLLRAAGSSSDL